MNTGFEGAEKILQMKVSYTNGQYGLRRVLRSEWQAILDVANCLILSAIENEFCTAYVLSESSLFVYDNKCIFKTCGRTTLLFVIPCVLELLRKYDLQLEYVLYTYKNYLFPEEQLYPHASWEDATIYLQKYFPDENSITLGDKKDNIYIFTYSSFYSSYTNEMNGDNRWIAMKGDVEDTTIIQSPSLVLFDAPYETTDSILSEAFDDGIHATLMDDFCDENICDSPKTVNMEYSSYEGGLDCCLLNMMMYDMDPEAAQQFYNVDHSKTVEEVTNTSGIGSIYSGSSIDANLFDPCGYSMNGLLGNGFYTIHITPEAHCSYASFETSVVTSDYSALVRKVLAIFKPQRFTLSFFYNMDIHHLNIKSPLCNTTFTPNCDCTYDRKLSMSKKKNGCYYSCGNYVKI